MKHILVADDDEDERELFMAACRQIDESIRCQTVSSGLEILSELNRRPTAPPDLIMLDINMHDMNGWDCLKELKSDIRFQPIPVILLSNAGRPSDKERAVAGGAVYFLTKPNDYSSLRLFLAFVVQQETRHLAESLRTFQV